MRKIFGLACVLLAGSFLLAGNFWNEKPYTEWSKEEASKILSDSPWVELQKISPTGLGVEENRRSGGGRPGGGSLTRGSQGRPGRLGAQRTRRYEYRLVSAKPVRMAWARLNMLAGSWDVEQAQKYVDSESAKNTIMIAVKVPPQQDRAELDQATTSDLQETTFLKLKKSKRKIGLARYVPPSEAGNVWGYFIFPRQEDGEQPITVSEKEIEFESRLNKDTKLRRKFKLKEMLFKGEVAL